MPVMDSIPAWLSVGPHPTSESCATNYPESTCATESGSESTPSSPPSSSSPPHSPFATPHSPPPSPFPDCEALSDTLLAKVAAGTECLASIASYHHIPFPRFTLWLLEPSTQARLAALSVAIASAARLTATAALPDIVRGLKTTVDQLQHPSHPTIAAPGGGPDALRAQSLILRRHRALIAAASLIYRISRFTCPGQHPQPRSSTSPKGEVRPKAGVGAPAFSPASSTSALRPSLSALPSLDLPAIIDFAPCHRDRPSEGDLGASPRTPASAPATPVNASSSSVFTSHFPHPTSHIEPPTSDTAPMPTEEALQTIIEEFDLTHEQAVELRKDPHSWIRKNILEQHGLVEVKPRSKRRSRKSADDG